MQRISASTGRLISSAALSCAVCCFAVLSQPSAAATQHQSPGDKTYKNGVLQKIADLLEAHYVLADKAKGYADEFRAKCASGAYDSSVEANDFADRVTADLIAITSDKHLNFRAIVASDVGDKAAGSLHHPVRYYHFRIKENVGFYKLEWIECTKSW